MQSTLPPPTLRKQNVRCSKPAFSVVAIHDGFFSGIRVMEATEWLKYTLCPDLQVYPVSWSFDTLERLDVRTTSARAAAAADLLIVSATDETPLPDHIKQWIHTIPKQQRDTRPILVALHEEDFEFNGTPSPFCSHLKEVADTWQTEFMCNADFDQRLDRDFATQLVNSKSPLSIHRSKPFSGEFQAAPRFWGING